MPKSSCAASIRLSLLCSSCLPVLAFMSAMMLGALSAIMPPTLAYTIPLSGSLQVRLSRVMSGPFIRPKVSRGANFGSRRSTPTMMPEGPEVRTLVDQLQPAVGMRLVDIQFLSGRYVRHGRPVGFESFAKSMTSWNEKEENPVLDMDNSGNGGDENRRQHTSYYNDDGASDHVDVIKRWSCKGKFIYLVLDEGTKMNDRSGNDSKDDLLNDNDYKRSIWITLGMTGRFVNEEEIAKDTTPKAANNGNSGKTPRWYMELIDLKTHKTRKIYYRDERNFGTLRFSLSANELSDKLASLGPDLLDFQNTTEEVFLQAMEKSKQNRNVCKFLMDQGKVSGIGNYILAEGLYRARVDPFADLGEISTELRRTLFQELREVVTTSYNARGLSRPNGGTYRDLDSNRGGFEFELQCYGQAISPNGYPVVKELNGPHRRTIWYVAEEQLFMPRARREANDSGNTGKAEDKTRLIDSTSSSDDLKNELNGKHVVSELTSHLIDDGWKDILSSHLLSESFESLSNQIASDLQNGATIYPPMEDIFSAFNLCPLENVKCVIVGQDPYHQPGQGHGLAFSVRRGVNPPPSLKNIFKEAIADVGIDPPIHGNLQDWAQQGVLLLNAVLTVRKGEANSHAKLGWEDVTDLVISTINERKEGVVFLLWGRPAAKKASCVDESRHTVIRTSHPSPLGATKTNSPFLGSRCFSRANTALIASGKDPIDWNVR